MNSMDDAITARRSGAPRPDTTNAAAMANRPITTEGAS